MCNTPTRPGPVSGHGSTPAHPARSSPRGPNRSNATRKTYVHLSTGDGTVKVVDRLSTLHLERGVSLQHCNRVSAHFGADAAPKWAIEGGIVCASPAKRCTTATTIQAQHAIPTARRRRSGRGPRLAAHPVQQRFRGDGRGASDHVDHDQRGDGPGPQHRLDDGRRRCPNHRAEQANRRSVASVRVRQVEPKSVHLRFRFRRLPW